MGTKRVSKNGESLKIESASQDHGKFGSKANYISNCTRNLNTNSQMSNRRVSAEERVVSSEPNGEQDQRGPTAQGWQSGRQEENKEEQGCCCCGFGGGNAAEETPVEGRDAEVIQNNETSADSRAKPEHTNDNNRGFNSTTANHDGYNGGTGNAYSNNSGDRNTGGVVGGGGVRVGGGGGGGGLGYDVYSSDRFDSGDDYNPGGVERRVADHSTSNGERRGGDYNSGGGRQGGDHNSNGGRHGGDHNNSGGRQGGDYNSGGGRGGYGDR